MLRMRDVRFAEATHTEDLLLSLPTPIAVVGNATPTRPWGSVIDRYASVIRMNNFRVDGFEALVGRRTDVRCTTGWSDIEHRNQHVEFSPFTSMECLAVFNARNARPVRTPRLDVRRQMPERAKPSTGFVLAHLFELLALPADFFGFDGFRTGHYWRQERHATVHAEDEIDALLRCRYVAVYTEMADGATVLPDREWTPPTDAADPTSDWLTRYATQRLHGQAVLIVGALDARAYAALERSGAHLVQVPHRPLAGSGQRPGRTSVLDLAFLEQRFDCCIALDVLDTLSPNACRIFVRQAARLSPRLLLRVRTADGPGRNRDAATAEQQPLRPVAWWRDLLSASYDITMQPWEAARTYAIHGRRREGTAACGLRTSADIAPARVAC